MNEHGIVELRREAVHLLKRGSPKKLRRFYTHIGLSELATLINILPQYRSQLFLALSDDERLEVMDMISLHAVKNLLDRLDDQNIVKLLEQSKGTLRTKLLRLTDQSRLSTLENLLVNDLKDQLALVANYPKRSIGRIMQPVAPIISQNATLKEARGKAEQYQAQIGALHNLYAVDEHEHYVGHVSIVDVLTASPKGKIKQYLRQDLPVISPHISQEHIATLFQKHDLLDAPVVQDGKVMGIVLVEDIMDVLQQQYLTTLQGLGGLGSSEETTQTPAFYSSRKRLPWMMLNIFLDLIAVSAVMPFQATIGQVTALAVFMPIISDMGGNVGFQAMAVGVRSITDAKITLRAFFRELRRELFIGFLNGLVLSLMIGLIGLAGWGNPYLGFIVVIALFINTILACLVGGALPMIFKKMKLDPALMSGAFLTTITDFSGFLIFLSLATLLLDKLT